MIMSEYQIEFIIYGDSFDPNLVSKELLITATKQWLKGEAIHSHPKSPKRKETCWRLTAPKMSGYYVEDGLMHIYQRLYSKQSEIIKLVKEHGLEVDLEIVIRFTETEDIPAVVIPPHILSFLASLNANLKVYTYAL